MRMHSVIDDNTNLFNDLHPTAAILSFLATKFGPDTMTVDKALWEPDDEKFIKAMEKEVADHVEQGHWEAVPVSSVP